MREFASALARKTSKGQGIQLDAPSKVYLDKHKTVPLLVRHSNSFANLDYFTLDRTAQVVTAHLETGALTMAKAAETPVNPPEENPGPGWSVEELEANAAEFGLGPRL